MIDYDNLRKKAEAATPGQWEYMGEHPNRAHHWIRSSNAIIQICNNIDEIQEADARYIAAMSPAVTLRLLRIIGVAKQTIVDIAIRAGRGPEAISIIQIARDGLKNISELEVDEIAKIEKDCDLR